MSFCTSFKIKKAIRFLCILFLTIFAVSCDQKRGNEALKAWMQENGKLKVLCTTAMVGDLVAHVGGQEIDCYVLIQGQHNPHSYQLVKGDDEKFLRADLIFYNGLGLEHGPSLANQLLKNPKAHALGDYLLEHYPHHILKSEGVLDPHVWMDISLFAKTLPFIARCLEKKRPEKKDQFMHEMQLYTAQLGRVHDKIRKMLHELPEKTRYLVTTHDAFTYFTRAYLAEDQNDFRSRCQAPEGLAPDSQLSTHDISRLLSHLIKYNIHCLFAESNISQDSIRKLLDASVKKGHAVRIAHSVLYGDAMGPSGSDADTYEKMILHNAECIKKELSYDQNCS